MKQDIWKSSDFLVTCTYKFSGRENLQIQEAKEQEKNWNYSVSNKKEVIAAFISVSEIKNTANVSL